MGVSPVHTHAALQADRIRLADTRIASPKSQLRLAVEALFRHRLALVGLCILACFVVVAILAPLIPIDPTDQDLDRALETPNFSHPLGTDSYGRDLATRVAHGSRLSLIVGLVPVALALLVGLPLGLLAGFLGGWFDAAFMRFCDALLSFPTILLAVAIMGTIGPSIQNVILALGFVYMPTVARLIRGSTLATASSDYVLSARAVGAGSARIAFFHILPNVIAPITILATVSFSMAILAEASLSFLGLGTQPPTPSWGLMLNEGHTYIETAPWIALVPGAAITLAVLAVNFLGDGLRDALDPQYRN
jgi:peptide/nickel transport system permease protein